MGHRHPQYGGDEAKKSLKAALFKPVSWQARASGGAAHAPAGDFRLHVTQSTEVAEGWRPRAVAALSARSVRIIRPISVHFRTVSRVVSRLSRQQIAGGGGPAGPAQSSTWRSSGYFESGMMSMFNKSQRQDWFTPCFHTWPRDALPKGAAAPPPNFAVDDSCGFQPEANTLGSSGRAGNFGAVASEAGVEFTPEAVNARSATGFSL